MKKRRRKYALFTLIALPLVAAGLAAITLRSSNPSLPDREPWSKFQLTEKNRKTAWLNSVTMHTWSFGSDNGAILTVKKFTNNIDQLEWLAKEWISVTEGLQTVSLDPYFPAITQELDCDPQFKTKLLERNGNRSIIFSSGAGAGPTPGACSKAMAEFHMYRRIFVCEPTPGHKESHLVVADLFWPAKQPEAPGLLKEFKEIPCTAFISR